MRIIYHGTETDFLRETLEEYTKEHMCAVNMAGIYDRAGDAWRESVNAPNPLHTYIVVNGTKYALPETKPKSHTQTLDFKNGLHLRKTQWQTENGTITVECERFASMSRRHLIAMRYTFFADFECEAEIVTGIDGDVWDINGPHFTKIQTGTQGSVNCVIGTTGEKNISVTANGFAGISEQDGKLVCRPSLPKNWKSMSFKLVYRGTVYKVNINGTKGEISY